MIRNREDLILLFCKEILVERILFRRTCSLLYKYYVSGHHLSSCFYLKQRFGDRILSSSSDKPTQLGPIDRGSSYVRTPAPIRDRVYKTKHGTNHLRELRQNVKNINKTVHVCGLAPEYYQHRSHHWRDKFSVWYQHKNMIFPLNLHWTELQFFTSAATMEVQMGEISKLGWIIGWSIRDMWGIPCIYYMWCLVQSARPSLLSNIFCGLLHRHIGLILIFHFLTINSSFVSS
jgi:hypothetical protein